MDTLIFSCNAILPIICLVLLGYFLRRTGILDDSFIKMGNRFVFTFCFSSLMFVNVYNIRKFDSVYRDIAIFATLSIIALMLIGLLWAVLFVRDPKQKGVMIQSFYRSNYAIIGIPLAASLYGSNGGPAAAIILACTIPLFNASSVIFLTVFIRDGKKNVSIKTIVYKIGTNPLILGIIAALVCQLIRPFLNGWTLKEGGLRFMYKTVENLAKIASPFALVILGGQFQFSAAHKLLSKIIVGVFVRLILAPVLGLPAAHFFFPQFKGPEYAALIALFGSPIAVSSAIMANQMNNDGELADQLLVWTTLFSMVSIFCIIVFFRAVGIF